MDAYALIFLTFKTALTLYITIVVARWTLFLKHLVEMTWKYRAAMKEHYAETRMRRLDYEQYP